MPTSLKDVVVLRPGDAQGNGMVVRLITGQGKDILAVAVPQDWPSRTGPTWTYLFENDGLTLVDAGALGSFDALADGLAQAGFRPRDIARVIITHGHQDHDGGARQLVEETGAQLWAHEVYACLLPYSPWDIRRRRPTPLQQEMYRVAEASLQQAGASSGGAVAGYRARSQQYLESRQQATVSRRLRDGEKSGQMAFTYAPGHSPDELCITLDGLVFTGDHVLPEITPHPTTKTYYDAEIKSRLPAEYQDEEAQYGLATFLKSLRHIADLGPGTAVLPAHRLFNKGRFNLVDATRAGEVIQHHGQRLGRIVSRIGTGPRSLEEITRGIFERTRLLGGNMYAALSEVVAHIELLQDTGDVELTEDYRLHWKGTTHYQDFLRELMG